MPYVYVIENKNKKHYVGITSLNPFERLIRHNKGNVYSTKIGKPWVIIYTESFNNIKEAREREKQIKSWKGGNAFKSFLSKVAGSSNGRTAAFGAAYLGSNPSPAALERNKNNNLAG